MLIIIHSATNFVERKEFSPSAIQAKTRVYSPLGIGSSVDFCYYFHDRMRDVSDKLEGGAAGRFILLSLVPKADVEL